MNLDERRGRRPATATLIRDAPEATGAGDLITAVSPVRARWTLPDGTERTGTVKASNGTRAGAPVPIWLDGAGNPVDAPVVRDDRTTTITVATGPRVRPPVPVHAEGVA
ncbi:MAG TPA: hypothetical protein VGR06_04660 [Actinophytocola sp.]|uniref:hypothetical protein n=1 Tax=Actinophytocola sp. TaxID=1872138 RepID=UPI002E0B41C2|nr:hypothetical protein [Actinophytocola sp.]